MRNCHHDHCIDCCPIVEDRDEARAELAAAASEREAMARISSPAPEAVDRGEEDYDVPEPEDCEEEYCGLCPKHAEKYLAQLKRLAALERDEQIARDEAKRALAATDTLIEQRDALRTRVEQAEAALEKIGQVVTLVESVGGCGDNSCLFARPSGGMATNGGCRCGSRGVLMARLAALYRVALTTLHAPSGDEEPNGA